MLAFHRSEGRNGKVQVWSVKFTWTRSVNREREEKAGVADENRVRCECSGSLFLCVLGPGEIQGTFSQTASEQGDGR